MYEKYYLCLIFSIFSSLLFRWHPGLLSTGYLHLRLHEDGTSLKKLVSVGEKGVLRSVLQR